MTDAVVPYTGWARGGWGSLEFGEGSLTPTPAVVGNAGSVTIFSEQNVTVALTGLQGTANFGGIMVEPDLNVFPGGVLAAASVSAVSDVVGEAIVSVSGEQAVSGFDAVALNIVVDVSVTGAQAIAQLSGVIVEPDMNVFPVGVGASAEFSGVEAFTSALVVVAGLSATAPDSGVDVIISVAPLIAGLQATATTAQVLVWDAIRPDQDSGFSVVAPSQSAGYSEVTPAQSPSYADITPEPSGSWVEIVPEAA